MKWLHSLSLSFRDLVSENTKYLKGLNETISSHDGWLNKNKLHFLVDENDQMSIDPFLYKCLRDPNILKSIIEENTIKSYQLGFRVYSPTTKSMTAELSRITEIVPLVKYNYHYIRDMLSLRNISPMRFGEISMERRLFRNYKMLADNTLSIMSRKWMECLVNIRTFHSRDDITFIYGNIFLLVKLGFYTVVWFKFTPGVPPVEDYPTSCDVFLNEGSNVAGYSKIIFQETKDISQTVVTAFKEDPFDKMGVKVLIDNNIPLSQFRVAVGLAIMIGFSLSIGVLPDLNEVLQY